MKELLPLNPGEFARANYGVDLTLLVEQLRLTPAERARKLESATTALERVRGIARRRS